MGKSNTELLKVAQSHLGQGGAKFRKFCGLPSGAAWCNAFVDYVANEGGDSSLYFNGAKPTYCPTSMKWCQKNLAMIPIYLAMPMDIIYFDWEPNNIPNHIGFVREHKSATEIYTIEGNTSGGIVAQKVRNGRYVCGVFRPHFEGNYKIGTIDVDGICGYSTIANLQKALKVEIDGILGQGTVKALQRKCGVSADGLWGNATSKAVQRMVGAKQDGYFGEESTKKLQEWINKQNAKPLVKKTKAQDINENAIKFAWKAGTPEAVYKYPNGKPTPEFIKAWKKYFPGKKYNCGCHQFVNLVIKASGYKGFPSYRWNSILAYLKENFTEIKVDYKQSQLKPGDIRVHKTTSGGYHIWVIVKEDGRYCRAEANQMRNKRYAHIHTGNGGNTKHHKADYLFRAK